MPWPLTMPSIIRMTRRHSSRPLEGMESDDNAQADGYVALARAWTCFGLLVTMRLPTDRNPAEVEGRPTLIGRHLPASRSF